MVKRQKSQRVLQRDRSECIYLGQKRNSKNESEWWLINNKAGSKTLSSKIVIVIAAYADSAQPHLLPICGVHLQLKFDGLDSRVGTLSTKTLYLSIRGSYPSNQSFLIVSFHTDQRWHHGRSYLRRCGGDFRREFLGGWMTYM